MAAVIDETVEITDESLAIKLRVENLAAVRENVQKKTFTRWANMSLTADDQILDLFEEFKTGGTLIKLINVLSGSSMFPEKGKMEIHHRSNIAKALKELSKVDPHHGISISSIYEGVPKLTLALVWHLILRYSHLHESDMNGVTVEAHCKNWCGSHTEGYPGLENIQRDFLGTWVTGLVLPAIINRSNPELMDYVDMYHNRTPHERFEHSFHVVESHYNVPRLLDVEDMHRAAVDDQSVITYLMSLNKAMPEEVPDPPSEIAELREEVLRAEARLLEEEDLPSDDSLSEDDGDLTPVEHEILPDIMAERDMSNSATPEPEEDMSPSTPERKRVADWTPSTPGGVGGELDSHRGSTLTLDSEAEYVSAASSPIMTSRRMNGVDAANPDLVPPSDYTDTVQADGVSAEDTAETDRQPIAVLKEALDFISAMPENIEVTLSNMEELKLLLAEKGDDCTELQRQISDQLNSKQEREKRADLHKLLNQTGKFDEVLHTVTDELDTFSSNLQVFETAVNRCQEFTLQAEQILSFEDTIPESAEETQLKLSEQQELLAKLETEQRQLESSYRALTRSVPKMMSFSLHDQTRTVTAVQNSLSDVEGILNGSVETLSFLSTRLPSLEQKLRDADNILTRTEDDLDSGESTGGLEDFQLQIDRAINHLATVENLFSAIESFSSEFNIGPIRELWEEMSERAVRCRDVIQDLVVAEEALSEEVVSISEWAETLESFLVTKIKPIESRDQLRDVQGKWRDVADDLNVKCSEIEALLHSGNSAQDHMSPLDRDALLGLKNQLSDLKNRLQTRRELLQEAYSNWGNVESQMKALSAHMTEMEFRPNGGSGQLSGPWSVFRESWSVRPTLRQVDELASGEKELDEQREQLQCLVENIGDLPGVIVQTAQVIRQRDSLLNKHAVLCKRASNKRTRLQGTSLALQPVLPFLRPVHLDKIRWLYNTPLPDVETRRDASTRDMVATLNSQISTGDVKYSQYWHIVKTLAPEKLPFMLFHLMVFAVGPWGMGCATDRPLVITQYTPDIKI